MAVVLMTELQIQEFTKKIAELKPKRVLEIGSYEGGSAEVIRKTIGRSNTLVCVDPAPRFDPKKIPVVLLQNKFHEAFNFDAVDEAQKFDLIFHDGDHSYEGVLRDLRLAKNVLKEGGTILIHDSAYPPTKQAIEQVFLEGLYVDGGELVGDYTFEHGQTWGGIWILQG